MNDVMSLLKDRREKAEGKVLRAAKALELAKKELADLQAAERVVGAITGDSPALRAGVGMASERDREITKLLEIGIEVSTSPIDLYPMYVEATGDDINLDAFRTALWRLQKKVIQADGQAWIVRSDNGRYWREAAADAPDAEELLG